MTAALCASVGSTLGILLGTFLYKDQFHQQDDGVGGPGGGDVVGKAKVRRCVFMCVCW